MYLAYTITSIQGICNCSVLVRQNWGGEGVGIIDIWRFPKFGNVLGVVERQVVKNTVCINHASWCIMMHPWELQQYCITISLTITAISCINMTRTPALNRATEKASKPLHDTRKQHTKHTSIILIKRATRYWMRSKSTTTRPWLLRDWDTLCSSRSYHLSTCSKLTT
jgi:hypothetical protein